ncbi:MAG: sigma-70 family RNA polymerase sigma factor [Candidatus Omnitrophica bacterium]|nr:sigma-70 family RNA polymerase sigma factor [Candidatus Omnitrophota bacterium]
MEAIRAYIERIKDIPLLSAKEERELARKARKGSKVAKRKLITTNLKLVVSIAKHYTRYGLSLMDLIEEGNLGLIKAIEKFKPSKGYRFSTYAAWWIRQAITRALIDQGRTIRIPVYMSEIIAKYKKTEEKLRQKLGRMPTRKELAKKLKLPIRKISEIELWMNKKASLEAPVGKDGESQLSDFIQTSSVGDTEKEIEYFFKHQEVLDLLSSLSEREKKILDLRFGIEDGKPRTLAEVAKYLGISRERVRQIEERALKKLRKFVKEQEEVF